MTASESIMRGLSEALDYSKGNTEGVILHEVAVPDVNVAAIRTQTGLSQTEFARSIGVKKGTLLNWEQGRRQPTGPAQILLALISKNPKLVQQLL